MPSATLLAGAALSFGAAAVLAHVGRSALRRPTAEGSRLAARMFALFWLSASVLLALVALPTLLGAFGVDSLQVHVALLFVRALPLTVALFGLMHYLVYIFTGKNATRSLVVLYSGFLALNLWFFNQLAPFQLESSAWDVHVTGRDASFGPAGALFGLALAGPVLVALGGYAALARRAQGRSQRYRVGLTSLALFSWFAPVLLAFLLGWTTKPWWPLLYQVPGVFASVLILMAFRPPARVRSMLGVRAYDAADP